MKKTKNIILIFIIAFLLTVSIGNFGVFSQPISQEIYQLVSSKDEIKSPDWKQAIAQMEINWEKEYENYFGESFSNLSITANKIAENLKELNAKTGRNSAAIWLWSTPEKIKMILTTSTNKPIGKIVKEAKGDIFAQVKEEFIQEVKNPTPLGIYNSISYLDSAQKLYKWMIAPIEPHLQAENIDTLIFCVGPGLRSFPFAALHDGEGFLVEKYSIAMVPTFNLTDMSINNNQDDNAQVLAMGKSNFKFLSPLPGVPLEISNITPRYWNGVAILNEGFTLDTLQSERQKTPFSIIHLATHAEFQPGNPSNSYIQLSDGKLTMDKIKELPWQEPPVELLVLSACRTAIGDIEAELGFAGLAIQSGVKSALASLWYVSDLGTVALMSNFYQHLKWYKNLDGILLKAEALRQTQIDMIKGKVYLEQGQLRNVQRSLSLPPELIKYGDENLSHPFYWAAFTLIGSPW